MMKRAHTPRPSSRRGARVLVSDACPACGTAMIERRATLRLPVNGEEIAVPGAAHLRCPECGEVLLRYQQSRRVGEDAIAIYRKKHGLLAADDIRPSSATSAIWETAPTASRGRRPTWTTASTPLTTLNAATRICRSHAMTSCKGYRAEQARTTASDAAVEPGAQESVSTCQ